MAQVWVGAENIDIVSLEKNTAGPEHGAICTFIGRTRNLSRGRAVLYLEYQAYSPMAEKQMLKIAEDAECRWGSRISIHHRFGKVEVEEASIVIVAAAPHRSEAFEACRYCIDAVKENVPIWKREVCEDGSYWIEGEESLPSGRD